MARRFATNVLRPGIYSAQVRSVGMKLWPDGETRDETHIDIVCDRAEANALLNYLRGAAQIVPPLEMAGERLIRLEDDDDED